MNGTVTCDWFGKGAAFHHVGIAVASIECCGHQEISVFEDPIQKVSVGFLESAGCRIELVAPLSTAGPVSAALKNKQKLLHLCFEVDDLDKSVLFAASRGFRCVAKPVPAAAFDGRRIAWLYSLDYGLFELLEKSPLQQPVCSQVAG